MFVIHTTPARVVRFVIYACLFFGFMHAFYGWL